jgi:hypothetical protein
MDFEIGKAAAAEFLEDFLKAAAAGEGPGTHPLGRRFMDLARVCRDEGEPELGMALCLLIGAKGHGSDGRALAALITFARDEILSKGSGLN